MSTFKLNIFTTIVLCTLLTACARAQVIDPSVDMYSSHTYDDITIENSYPRGGPYPGAVDEYHNYSYLVFYCRFVNQGDDTLSLNLNSTGFPNKIPGSEFTYMKLVLPSDTMDKDKKTLFSYDLHELKTLKGPTAIERLILPGEDCYIYHVGLFYQTEETAPYESRGGNRAEILLEGESLYYRMPPQIKRTICGSLISAK